VKPWVRINRSVMLDLDSRAEPMWWETLASGGCGEAQIPVGAPRRDQRGVTTPDALLEILYGPIPVWFGRIVDADLDDGTIIGRPIYRDAYEVPALDGTGAITRNPLTAWTTMKAGVWTWPVTDPTGYVGAMPDATGDRTEPQSLGDLFDEVCEQTGTKWGVYPDGAFYWLPDPTTPSWLASPDSGALGMSIEGRATHLLGRYTDTGGVYQTVTATDPEWLSGRAVWEPIDLTPRGKMTQAEALTILNAAFGEGRGGFTWVNGANLTARRLTTPGGTPAFLPGVTAIATSMRVLDAGITSEAQGREVVIGRTRYTAGSDTILVEPARAAVRSFADIIGGAA
jgi:hypothetical protein